MHVQTDYIHKHTAQSFDVEADLPLYEMIAQDMLQNAGDFTPRLVWQKLFDQQGRYQEKVLSDHEMRDSAQKTIEEYHNLSLLMDSWVGTLGKRDVLDEEMTRSCHSYMERFSDCAQFNQLMTHETYAIQQDLLTTNEIAILATLLKEQKELEILEIGGGYGRLCEGVMNSFHEQIHYVMTDSVPVSLMFSYLFLSKNLPDKKIGIYYLDEKKDPSRYDVYILPTWRMEELYEGKAKRFNLAFNIQSMQEMSQWHVDYYLGFFDRFSTPNALFYLHNNKEYIFRGDWHYPNSWRLLFRHNTPWSWSDDDPVEVFQKVQGDQRNYNGIVSFAHNENVRLRKEKSDMEQTMQTNMAKEQEVKHMLATKLAQEKEEKQELSRKIDAEIQRSQVLMGRLMKDEEEKQDLVKSIAFKEKEYQTVVAKAAQYEEEKQRLARQLDAEQKEHKRLSAYLTYITHSWSWRITKPLRSMRKFLKSTTKI